MSASSRPVCVLFGGGGHARVLIDCVQSSQAAELAGILDSNPSLWGKSVLNVPVLGGDELLPELLARGVDHFAVGLGSTGDAGPRRKLYELGLAYGLKPLMIIHPRAIISSWAEIGRGAQLLPGCIVNAGAVLGENVIVNSGAIVEHDCRIGDHVHVASGARLASTVQVGSGAHIGLGASVRQCISIGSGAIVGAGAVVVRDVPPGVTVVGVPARPLARRP